MDKELSHQVTDVVENHSIEQAGRKQKKSQCKVKYKTGKQAPSVLRRAVKASSPGALTRYHVAVLLPNRQVADQGPGCGLLYAGPINIF